MEKPPPKLPLDKNNVYFFEIKRGRTRKFSLFIDSEWRHAWIDHKGDIVGNNIPENRCAFTKDELIKAFIKYVNEELD